MRPAKGNDFVVAIISIIILFILAASMFAADKAMIISCRSGDAQLHEQNKENTQKIIGFLKRKGIKDISVFFDGGNSELAGSQEINKADILSKLSDLAIDTNSNDKFYLFLFGHASASPRRVSLATRKGRLTGKQLVDKLNKIKAEQYIFCLNTQSHGLMHLLAHKDRLVLCATDSYGQLNPPHFTTFFTNQLAQGKNDNLLQIAKKSGKLTAEFYNDNSLAMAENSQIYFKGKTLSYPFDGANREWVSLTVNNKAEGPTSKPEYLPELEETKVYPATPESLALLKKAVNISAKYTRHAAIYLKRDISLSVKKDNSSQVLRNEVIYLNKDVAAEFFNVFRIPLIPGSTSRITQAKVIFPDGSYTLFDANRKNFKIQLTFNGLRKGCVLVRAAEINYPAPAQLPEYNNLLRLQTSFPVIACRLDISSPLNSAVKFKSYNCTTKRSTKKNNYSQTVSLQIQNLPAYNRVPGDPGFVQTNAYVLVSNMNSWKNFAEWSNRMFRRASEIDKETETFLKKMVSDCKTDSAKIKRIYNFLCKLRYLTTPVGAAAFRPRQPGDVVKSRYGDCKDKANALVVFANILGIKAYRVLVNRNSYTDKEFPAWQFNHMIAYFPNLKEYPDGLWLDATDGATAFGTLPPGDIGRLGMLFKKQSYEFKKIKALKNSRNLVEQDIQIEVSSDKLSLQGSAKVTLHELPAYYFRQKTKRLSPRQSKHFMVQYLIAILPEIELVNYKFISSPNDISVPLKFQISFKGKRWMLDKILKNAGSGVFKEFSKPQRKYGLLLNDNQRLEIIRKIKLKGCKPLKTIEYQNKGKCISIDFNQSENQQFFHLKLLDTDLSSTEYLTTRKQILNFKDNINGAGQ